MAGVMAQTFIYPLDVMRRRMQTGQAAYTGLVQGLLHIARTEGVIRGLYRGLSLNYAKVTFNLSVQFLNLSKSVNLFCRRCRTLQ